MGSSFPNLLSHFRLGQTWGEQRLCISSWRTFASTHPRMLSSSSPREALLACSSSPPWNLAFFTVEFALSSPCSRSDPPSLAKVRLSLTSTLFPLMIWYSGQTALFLLEKAALAYLLIALSVALRPLFLFQLAQCSSFSAEACTIVQALCWSRKHQQVCLSIFPFASISLADPAGTVFSVILFYQATMGPWTLVFPGERCG